MRTLPRRRLVLGAEIALGVMVVLAALYETHETFRPLGGQPIDGRGLFSVFVIPPIAAAGGVLVAHALSQSVLSGRSHAVSLLLSPVCTTGALLPSIAYLVFYSGAGVSKELTTYTPWFGVALAVSLIPVVYGDLSRRR